MEAKRLGQLGLAILLAWGSTGPVDPDVGRASSSPYLWTDADTTMDSPVLLAKKKKKRKDQAPPQQQTGDDSGASRTNAPTISPFEPLRTSPSRRTVRQDGDPFLITVGTGFSNPVLITHAGDNSGRLFVVEKTGAIRIIQPNGQVLVTPFLNVADQLGLTDGELGLLSVAFHPNYAGPGQGAGQFFIWHTVTTTSPNLGYCPCTDVLARYTVSGDPNVADPLSRTVLFAIPDFAANHNGGMLAFRNGLLYISTGDGGGGGDNDPAAQPEGNGQRTNSLLGKILRVDVNATGAGNYGIPAGNPTLPAVPIGSTPRPEIWDYGFRNPWRFSFDRTTGDMFIGDVGQGRVEEIDFEPSNSPGGGNYGWRVKEGTECFNNTPPNFGPPLSPPCPAGGLEKLPILEYTHSRGCSVTGGYVYRGTKYPALDGGYFYSDACSGVIWRAVPSGLNTWSSSDFMSSPPVVSSFGEDQAGEVYVLNLGGTIYRIADPVCSPRPNVQVTAVPGTPGNLLATVIAGTNSSTPDNQLFSIQFTQFDNAIVDINGSNNHSTPLSVDLTTTQTTFTVRRPLPAVPGLPTTARFVVTDACGTWPSLVGGGAGSF